MVKKKDKDAMVIEALIRNGSDTSKPHNIDFFFDFDSFDSATSVAKALRADGFDVQLYDNNDGTFTIETKKLIVPALSTMNELTVKFNALVKQFGGNYDGWGTEIVE